MHSYRELSSLLSLNMVTQRILIKNYRHYYYYCWTWYHSVFLFWNYYVSLLLLNVVSQCILILELLCRIIIVERGNKANSYEELLLCIIIILIVLVVLLLVYGRNCTPVVENHFTCMAPRHNKLSWLSSSTATCRRVWLGVAPKREHCWIYACDDFDNYCGVHHYCTPTLGSITAYGENWSRAHSCCSIRFILAVSIAILFAGFQGTAVVVGSCICCNIAASRMKYRYILFNRNY